MWHYVRNGQGFGPVEPSVIQALLQNGTLSPDALVWKAGMAEWVPARTVAEFASTPAAGAAPPPIPPISPIPPLNPPPRGPTTSMDPETYDIEHNKVFAVLAYIGILFLVPLLAAPNSKFARFHTNQGIVLFLAGIIVSFGMVAIAMIPFIHLILIPIIPLLPLAVLIFVIIGIVHAATGTYKPLPLIGHYKLLG